MFLWILVVVCESLGWREESGKGSILGVREEEKDYEECEHVETCVKSECCEILGKKN